MNDHPTPGGEHEAPSPDALPPEAAAPPPAHAPHPHPRAHYALLAVLALSLAFGAWGAFKVFAPAATVAPGGSGVSQSRVDELEQQVATLTRSDQISRDANTDLQGTLAERDEEISGLRADVAFYERLVGATGQRRGLSVHELKLQPQGDDAWHFTATLTQNLNRGAVSSGRLTLAIEGTADGKLQRLSWADLRQEEDAEGAEYSFKYFQQLEGEIVLPAGFKPLRVHARLAPQGGKASEQSIPWTDATAQPEETDA